MNWSEIVQKTLAHGIALSPTALRDGVKALGVTIIPFGIEDAELCEALWRETRSTGLSLADRACLALAQRTSRPALTADRRWAGLGLLIAIRQIR